MKNGNINLNLKDLPVVLDKSFRRVAAYKVFIFFLVVAALYGFIVFSINKANNVPASTSESAHTAAQPHIDPDTISKIQSLQDNSVSVQALFDQARQNPFQE